MLSPKKFADKSGLAYGQVLMMCKSGELNSVKTQGGHFKILEKEIDKFIENDDYVPKEKYLHALKENERLKTLLGETKRFINGLKLEDDKT